MLGDCKDGRSYKVIPDTSVTKQGIRRFLMAKNNMISEEDLSLKS